MPAGAELIFQMDHADWKADTTARKSAEASSKGKGPSIGIRRTKGTMNLRFKIPAGAAEPSRLESLFMFFEKGTLLWPMMHEHPAKGFRYLATPPNRKSEVVLSVAAVTTSSGPMLRQLRCSRSCQGHQTFQNRLVPFPTNSDGNLCQSRSEKKDVVWVR